MTDAKEYAARRGQLAGALPNESVALIFSAREMIRNGDVHHRFRQDSDFYYFTGFEEPDAVLLVYSGSEPRSLLFVRPRDPLVEQWTGERLGPEQACERLGVQHAYSITDLDQKLPELVASQRCIHYFLGRDSVWDERVLALWSSVQRRSPKRSPTTQGLADLSPYVRALRLIKSPFEIECMRIAAQRSVFAHQCAMRASVHAQYEYEVEAAFLGELTRLGSRNLAYDSIVAGGAMACILHYTANDRRLNTGDLLLIDAGGEYQNYAADITRTYPVRARFSTEQALIYDLVYQSQQAGIACVRPGVAWVEIQQAIVRVLTQGLCDLGILTGAVDDLMEKGAYKPYYMHNSGHWLGLDVHDVGDYYQADGQSKSLEPGMVLTVEPGLYLSSHIKGLNPRWWNIGVRIEDDVLVTSQASEILSCGLPSQRLELEAYLCD